MPNFLNNETKIIKNEFLSENKNFSHLRFKLDNNNEFSRFIDSQGDFHTLPSEFNDHMIDGFYATKFIRND